MRDEDLTPEDFDRLLLWLDSDREEAAIKYEKTRLRLIKFFVCGGCGCDAERLSDEAFDRVSRRLKTGTVSEPACTDKVFYFLGFAKNIRHEYLRPKPVELVTPLIALDKNEDNSDIEEEFECLDQCMEGLSIEKRQLVIEYYLFEKTAKISHRKKMASQLGIDLKALRLRVHRIREQLRPCIENCIARRKPHRNDLAENGNNN